VGPRSACRVGVGAPTTGKSFHFSLVRFIRVEKSKPLFTDGVPRPVYEDEGGQFIVEDGERIDGVWLVPEEDGADTPVIVALGTV
jgi:hypothetical protein